MPTVVGMGTWLVGGAMAGIAGRIRDALAARRPSRAPVRVRLRRGSAPPRMAPPRTDLPPGGCIIMDCCIGLAFGLGNISARSFLGVEFEFRIWWGCGGGIGKFWNDLEIFG